MGRPRINPNLRYDFEINMWRAAVTKGAASYTCETPKEAIHLNHRLNMARAAIRDQSQDGYMDWDVFVARHKDCTVTIERKRELNITDIKDGEGNPLTSDDWMEVMDAPLLQPKMPVAKPKPAPTPTLMPPPPETHDHTKPLDLDIADE